MTTSDTTRPFKVRARHEEAHHGRIVLETSFEAAAIAYAEHLPHGGETEVSLLVHDMHSGHEHWLRIDLEPDLETNQPLPR